MGLAPPALATNTGSGPRDPRLPIRFWPAARWLIIVNVATFVLNLLLGGRLADWALFSTTLALRHMQLWRLITFQFVHSSPIQLLFNMLFLYFFGQIIEPRLGRRRFVAFYLLCGLGGAAACVLLWRLRVLVNSADFPLVGASSGIFGLAAAAAVIDPHYPIRLFWPPVTLSLRTMVLIYLALAIVMIWLDYSAGGGGEAAHLGGAIVGFFLIRNPAWLAHLPFKRRRRRFWKPGDPAENFFRRDNR